MDDPPPPYSSIDPSKVAGNPPKNVYPPGPLTQNQYGATSYPAAATYQGPPISGPVVADPFYPVPMEPQPQIVVQAPTAFTRFGGMQSIRGRYTRYSSFGTHILLSCFVICCCGPGGFMCGVLAFCVAICAQSFAESSPQLSRQLGNVSMTLSLAGVAVSLLMVTIIFYTGGFQVHSHNLTAVGNSTLDCLYPVGDRCFSSRKFVKSMRSCYDGYYLNPYCYRQEQPYYKLHATSTARELNATSTSLEQLDLDRED